MLALIKVQFWTTQSVVSPFALLSTHNCLVIVTQEVSRRGASQVLATVWVALLQAWQLSLLLCSAPPLMCAASLLGHNWLAMLLLQKPSGKLCSLIYFNPFCSLATARLLVPPCIKTDMHECYVWHCWRKLDSMHSSLSQSGDVLSDNICGFGGCCTSSQ